MLSGFVEIIFGLVEKQPVKSNEVPIAIGTILKIDFMCIIQKFD